MSERQFDESEIGLILQRASELQAGAVSGDGHGLTLSDIQRLATEVGIDPIMVERAARELSSQPKDAVVDERAISILLDQTVDGVLDEEGWEEVVAGLRLYAKRSGTTRQRGLTSEWVCRSETGGVTFGATRRGQQTRFRLIGDMAAGIQAMWSTAPPICFVIGVVTAAVLSKRGLIGPPWAIALGATVVAAGCIGTHFASRAWAKRARAELRSVFEGAVRAVRPETEAAPAPLMQATESPIVQRLG